MVVKLVVRTAVWIGGIAVLLFACAGTLRWPQAWIFLLEITVCGLAIGFWLARHDPGLLAERLGSVVQRDQERSDKMFMAGLVVLWTVWLAVMPLDAVRFRWSHMPAWAQWIGALLILPSMYANYLTFRENSFASPVVKVQKERGQRVVTTGPYRYVRHPMYAGTILLFLGTPLLLGSGYGLAFLPVWAALLAFRIRIEEQALTQKLEGYRDYIGRVRYRLIPGIW